MVLKYSLVLIVVILLVEVLSKPVSNVITSSPLSADSKETKKFKFEPFCNKMCQTWKLLSQHRKEKKLQTKG